jgi:aspartate kinase
VNRTHLVLKFGGTSLSTRARLRRAALRVRAQRELGFAPVVVVSATGSTTDRIIRRLTRLSHGPAALPPRETDRALATGEDLASALLAAALAAIGIPARSLRGGEAGVRVDGGFGSGRIAHVDPAPLRELTAAGVVPVVSGFQGYDAAAETVTLGRGGSDTSAVAIAAALGGVACHIVTDVAAVHDRDPHRVEGAVPLPVLSHRALVELTAGGARVVHPAAAEIAELHAVPLRIYHHAARPGREGGTVIEAPPIPLEVAV